MTRKEVISNVLAATAAAVLLLSLYMVFVRPKAIRARNQEQPVVHDEWLSGFRKAPGIYDDDLSVAYLQLDNYGMSKEERLSRLIDLKNAWMRMYPDKRIISVTSILHSPSAAVAGWVIHYEQPERSQDATQ